MVPAPLGAMIQVCNGDNEDSGIASKLGYYSSVVNDQVV